jgi:phosphonate transport system substrate-binding protein
VNQAEPGLGITATPSTDLVHVDEELASHKPDIGYIPAADYHRLFGKGDRYYRGLAITTSKFTGEPTLRSLVVVRKDDPANTKIIGEYTGGKPPVVVVREGLDEAISKTLLDALLAWIPAWDGVYGAFKPFYYAGVHPFFHALDGLPSNL